MSAVVMWVRTVLRARWRAWFALALAFGVAGGAATAAAAGARRTESAYPRFLEASDAYHVTTGGLGSGTPEEHQEQQRAIAALPQVKLYALSQFVGDRFVLPSGTTVTFPEAIVTGDATGADLITVNRAKVVRGRMFDPNTAGEAVADVFAAQRLGIEVGDRLGIPLLDPETFEPTEGKTVTIVGVVVAPGTLPSVGQTPPMGIVVSPAFVKENTAAIMPNEDAPSVRLHDASMIPAFIQGARKIAPTVDIPVVLPRHLAGVRKTLRFDVGALWILCALLALAAITILGQAVGRQIALDAGEHASLRALGMGRTQLIAADLVRAFGVGCIGAVVAVAVAYAASPLTPRGLAGLVEPDPGAHADWAALAIGAAATLVAAMLVALPSAIRATRASVEQPESSRIASALARVGASAPMVAGTRLALEPGRGSRTVPVRAAILGIAVALASLTAAVAFTKSLDTLINRPDLYGFTWDVFAGSEDAQADLEYLRTDPDVVATSPGGYANIEIAGKQLIPLVYVPGTIAPAMIEGRAPRDDDEIALGGALLRSLGLKIGDTVDVKPAESRGPVTARVFRIVGRPVVPPIFFQQLEPGDSSAMTLEGAYRVDPEEREEGDAGAHLIRFRRGVDVRAKIADMREKLPGLFVGQVRQPGAELTALSTSTGLPIVLTSVLLVAAIGTLMHTLVTTIRKRRRDLAILKTLGFVKRQVRAAVAWKATVLVILGVLMGVPAGALAGTWAWTWFAGTIGVVPEPTPPLLLIAVAVPLGALLLGNLIAAMPARVAVRTHAAEVLRAE